jgi:hypothetical protein
MQSHLLFDCSRDDRSLHCPCQFHTPLSLLEPCDQAVITALFLFPFSLERSPVLRIPLGNPTTLSPGASHCSSLALSHNTPAGEGGIHLPREHATPESHTALAPYPLTYSVAYSPRQTDSRPRHDLTFSFALLRHRDIVVPLFCAGLPESLHPCHGYLYSACKLL